MNWQKWLRARWVLGWALVKHVLYKPFAGKKGDPGIWLARIGQEALGPTPPGNWEAAAKSSRCIACGLCDSVESRQRPAPGGDARAYAASLSHVIAGAARLPSDAPDALIYVPRLLACAQAVRAICPTGVDPSEVAHMIQRNAEVLKPIGALASAAPQTRA
jgi:ferredoxin